ncbi:MAG: transcriptional regulator [Thermodesulfobacteriota bacterium]
MDKETGEKGDWNQGLDHPDRTAGNSGVPEQPRTVRQRIIELLDEQEMSARELSQRLGVREREIYEHLVHIARSVAARGKRLQVPPFDCLSCGYVFRERERFTRPSRCPRCKRSHIQTPVYRLT